MSFDDSEKLTGAQVEFFIAARLIIKEGTSEGKVRDANGGQCGRSLRGRRAKRRGRGRGRGGRGGGGRDVERRGRGRRVFLFGVRFRAAAVAPVRAEGDVRRREMGPWREA